MFIFDLDVSQWLVLAVVLITVLLVLWASALVEVRAVQKRSDEWRELAALLSRIVGDLHSQRTSEWGDWMNADEYDDDEDDEYAGETEDERMLRHADPVWDAHVAYTKRMYAEGSDVEFSEDIEREVYG